MKEKDLMLFGLKPEQSSYKGLWIFLFIYIVATLIGAILTPPAYWIAQYINEFHHSEDTQWLVNKGIDDFFDRIRWIPIILGLPFMMRACGLFSISYIGLEISKYSLGKFVKYFAFGASIAFVIFTTQIIFSKSHKDANAHLPNGSYTLKIANAGNDISQYFEVRDIQESKAQNYSLEGLQLSIFQYGDTDSYNNRHIVFSIKNEKNSEAKLSSLQSADGKIYKLSNITKKNNFELGVIVILKAIICSIFGVLLLAIIEEVVFRVLIFRSIYTAWGLFWGATLSSLFFAYKHFKVPNNLFDNIAGGLTHADWYSGFIVAYYDTIGVFTTFHPTIFLALTVFGAVLTMFYVNTKTLLAPIGFHAGIVLSILTYRGNFYIDLNASQQKLFGGAGLSDGYAGFVLLSIILVFAVAQYLHTRKN